MFEVMRTRLSWFLMWTFLLGAAPLGVAAAGEPGLMAKVAKKKKKKRRRKKKGPELKPLPSYLMKGYKNTNRVRVRPLNFEKVRLIPDGYSVGGPVVGRPTEVPPGLAVVKPGDMPRVIIEDGPVRALLYIPSDNLQSVIIKPTVGWPEARPAPRGYSGPGLYLQPGAHVRVVSKQGDLVRVRLKDHHVDLFSWIPKARVGRMYVPVQAQRFIGNAWIKPGTVVSPNEGGGMLGHFRGDAKGAAGNIPVRKLGTEKSGKQLVEYGTRNYSMRGWVDKSAFVPKGKVIKKRVKAKGTGPGETNPNRVRLHKGTRLFDSEGGDVIGVVKQDNTFFADQRILPGGWIRIRHYSSWGLLSMWAQVDVAAYGAGTFGEMIRSKKLFWLADESGTTRCQQWKIRQDRKGSFEGGMDWAASRNGRKITAGYRYQYAMGMVVLQGPGTNSRALSRRGAPSDFYALSILSCGSRCLQVGTLRWYFDAKSCERARARGVKGSAIGSVLNAENMNPDSVADEIEKSSSSNEWGDDVGTGDLKE